MKQQSNEIDYYGDYVRGLDELEYLRKHTILLPISIVRVGNLRMSGKEREANVLEYEQRFKFWMKACEKDWNNYFPNGEQSLNDFAHEELGKRIQNENEEEKGRSR